LKVAITCSDTISKVEVFRIECFSFGLDFLVSFVLDLLVSQDKVGFNRFRIFGSLIGFRSDWIFSVFQGAMFQNVYMN
jgi:hypothetical protein